jgi:hypothetical protein
LIIYTVAKLNYKLYKTLLEQSDCSMILCSRKSEEREEL